MSSKINWEYIGHVAGGEPFYINGINVWDYEWSCETVCGNRKAVVKDSKGNLFDFDIWSISPLGVDKLIFCAGEYSNGVYGFYREKSS